MRAEGGGWEGGEGAREYLPRDEVISVGFQSDVRNERRFAI